MSLAIEERELQKMAALTRQDSQTDALRAQVEQLQQVRKNSCYYEVKIGKESILGSNFLLEGSAA